MIRDMPADKFEKLSNEAKKKYVVQLLIKESGASPVHPGLPPVAFVMAGVPGAGKTEFLDSLVEELEQEKQYGEFVRIDLDQIVTIYPEYTPKTYAKFRSQGSSVLARCIDELRHKRYNMMIDGTFSGEAGSSVRNVEKLLSNGYRVIMVYMYDKPEIAWNYTQLREQETDRGITINGFIHACKNVSVNLKTTLTNHRANINFSISVVKQKELRDRNYEIITDEKEVDKIIEAGYNIDSLKETL